MKIAIIKYNAGNVVSVLNALERLGHTATVTDDPTELRAADRVIFPGVGEARAAMDYLQARALPEVLRSLTQPVLGICLGLQLLCAHSEERDTPCIGVFPNRVRLFPAEPGHKVPHMGWNSLIDLRHPLFDGVAPSSHVYFVHSYYADLSAETAAVCHYGLPFSAALQHGNFYAVQFHPEKSGDVGAKILSNFLTLTD